MMILTNALVPCLLVNRLAWGLTFMGVFCMWLFWACVYMHQMYPLVSPIIEAH